jgi:hypothetical protein
LYSSKFVRVPLLTRLTVAFDVFVDGRRQSFEKPSFLTSRDLRAGRGLIASAAQLFHDDLYVDVADAAGGDEHVVTQAGDNEGGLDAGNVQQLVGGLAMMTLLSEPSV